MGSRTRFLRCIRYFQKCDFPERESDEIESPRSQRYPGLRPTTPHRTAPCPIPVSDQVFTVYSILPKTESHQAFKKTQKKKYKNVFHTSNPPKNIIFIYIYINQIILYIFIVSIFLMFFMVFHIFNKECWHYFYDTLCSPLSQKLGGRSSIPSFTYVIASSLLHSSFIIYNVSALTRLTHLCCLYYVCLYINVQLNTLYENQ